MLDPLALTARMLTTATDLAGTARRVSQAASASQQVIARRSTMIATAVRSPGDGNYAELSRMGPEKVYALARAGNAVTRDWLTLQSSLLAEASHWGSVALTGRAASPTEWATLSSRYTEFVADTIERSIALGAAGLQPLLAAVNANAHRLRRTHG